VRITCAGPPDSENNNAAIPASSLLAVSDGDDMDLFLQIADAINKEISKILAAALRGDEKYRYQGDFIRWGLVEKDIHAVVEKNLTADAN
jgi:hypothetical protein